MDGLRSSDTDPDFIGIVTSKRSVSRYRIKQCKVCNRSERLKYRLRKAISTFLSAFWSIGFRCTFRSHPNCKDLFQNFDYFEFHQGFLIEYQIIMKFKLNIHRKHISLAITPIIVIILQNFIVPCSFQKTIETSNVENTKSMSLVHEAHLLGMFSTGTQREFN